MGAAFGAARHMDNQPVVQMRRGGRGNIGRNSSRGDVCGGAQRRPGASDHMPARIVGASHKAELCCGGQKACRVFSRYANHQKTTVRRGTQPAPAGRRSGIGKSFERVSLGVAEGQSDATGQITIAECMQADRVAALALR